MAQYIPLSDRLCVRSGVKQLESTAFGITDTIGGWREALNTVFSLLRVCVRVCTCVYIKPLVFAWLILTVRSS